MPRPSLLGIANHRLQASEEVPEDQPRPISAWQTATSHSYLRSHRFPTSQRAFCFFLTPPCGFLEQATFCVCLISIYSVGLQPQPLLNPILLETWEALFITAAPLGLFSQGEAQINRISNTEVLELDPALEV